MLEQLADVLVQCDLHEISLEQDGVRLELHAPSPLTAHVAAPVLTAQGAPVIHAATPAIAAPQPVVDENLVTVVSPMVGIFYRSPSPSDPHFVEVGDHVEVGQTVGLVEAMKVFNEIISEVEGTVVAIQAENSDLVESGSSLLLVRPAGK